MLLRVLRQPSALSVLRKTLSCAAVANKKIEIKDHYDFDKKVVNNANPVIVNFHAEWCDPCKILTPKLEELLGESSDIDLAVLDVESHIDLVHTFEVKAVPAVLCFRNGVVVDKFIGLLPNVQEWVEQSTATTAGKKGNSAGNQSEPVKDQSTSTTGNDQHSLK